tara:strand:+ start:117 stop:314 length:198 start_codon:yes stop_codon:yes gene_type:complete
MYNINKFTIKDIIKQELLMLENNNFNYYGSEKQIENENNILNFTKLEIDYNETIEEYYNRIFNKY